jgi:hypothetical protein
MAERDPEYHHYYLDPAMWPEFMRAGLMRAPPSAWPDAAVPDALINAPDVGMPAGLLLPMMPRASQQAPDQDAAAPLFLCREELKSSASDMNGKRPAAGACRLLVVQADVCLAQWLGSVAWQKP